MNVTTIGIDLAKSVFQLHGVDAQGAVGFCQIKRLVIGSGFNLRG